jgi:hypothetical protein
MNRKRYLVQLLLLHCHDHQARAQGLFLSQVSLVFVTELQVYQIHVLVPHVVQTLTVSQHSRSQFVHIQQLLFTALEQSLVPLLELHTMEDPQSSHTKPTMWFHKYLLSCQTMDLHCCHNRSLYLVTMPLSPLVLLVPSGTHLHFQFYLQNSPICQQLMFLVGLAVRIQMTVKDQWSGLQPRLLCRDVKPLFQL